MMIISWKDERLKSQQLKCLPDKLRTFLFVQRKILLFCLFRCEWCEWLFLTLRRKCVSVYCNDRFAQNMCRLFCRAFIAFAPTRDSVWWIHTFVQKSERDGNMRQKLARSSWILLRRRRRRKNERADVYSPSSQLKYLSTSKGWMR